MYLRFPTKTEINLRLVRQLSDILREKVKEHGKAGLGRLLGGISGQGIGQYINGSMPSFEIAIKWKEVFDENLIDLMYPPDPVVMEQEPKYERVQDKLIHAQEALIRCQQEKEDLRKERDELKNFLPIGNPAKLKKVKK